MNSQSPCAPSITQKITPQVMKENGGATARSILWRWRRNCGSPLRASRSRLVNARAGSPNLFFALLVVINSFRNHSRRRAAQRRYVLSQKPESSNLGPKLRSGPICSTGVTPRPYCVSGQSCVASLRKAKSYSGAWMRRIDASFRQAETIAVVWLRKGPRE